MTAATEKLADYKCKSSSSSQKLRKGKDKKNHQGSDGKADGKKKQENSNTTLGLMEIKSLLESFKFYLCVINLWFLPAFREKKKVKKKVVYWYVKWSLTHCKSLTHESKV